MRELSGDLDRRRSDPAWQQIRAERAIAAPYMGRFEPLLVAEGVLSFVGWGGLGVAGVAGWLPYWLSVPFASVFVFISYMPLHEATHHNIHGSNRKLRWLNDAVGHLCSIPLMLDFPGHQISHMNHHAHTNEVGRDPDLVYAGPAWKVAAISLVSGLMNTLVFGVGAWIAPLRKPLLAELEKQLGPQAERALVYGRRFQTLAILVTLAIAFAGYPLEILMFWILPAQIGLLMIGMIFAWLPHHPHNGHGRYTNTRATLFPGSGLIALGHDRHIIHHMIPGIPHYRIPRVFDELRPVLEARGTRIEGRRAGPHAPKVFLGSDPERILAIEREATLLDERSFD